MHNIKGIYLKIQRVYVSLSEDINTQEAFACYVYQAASLRGFRRPKTHGDHQFMACYHKCYHKSFNYPNNIIMIFFLHFTAVSWPKTNGHRTSLNNDKYKRDKSVSTAYAKDKNEANFSLSNSSMALIKQASATQKIKLLGSNSALWTNT